ncbi:cyclin-A2-like [Monodelphis domestica]|uniref:cyclin-A2-like n=1 Tax=Monodelphis domestica TaxID=13616 RepID=UPI0024E223AE|nr:cyclin-A2-like [Monodelphis domestica]
MDEPCGEREKEFLSLKKVQCEDKRWDFNSAVSLPATSRPLVPCNQTMDIRFEASLPLETSMKLEAPRKLPSIMEVSDYAEDIYLYLKEMEVKFKLNVDYMKNQPDTIENLRVLLLNWLVVAGQLLELQNETLHLAVNYFDRYLSLEPVSPETLQLLGIAALRLATKFEEAYPLRMIQLIHHMAGQYTKKQITGMECRMLQVLAFHLALPTINQFLTQYFLHQQQPNPHVESLAMFLGELCLVDTVTYLKYLPSVTAGAAFHLALYTVTGKSWPKSLVQKTGYTLESLKPCLMDLHWTYFSASQHAVYSIPEKYRKPMYHGVAHIPPPETLNLE